MTRILIRCDASLSIGSGHVMRCRTLARELQSRGAEVLFLCRRQAGDLIALLEQEFAVFPLPELPLLDGEGLGGRDRYRAWLGCSQEQDAVDCLQALGSAGIGDADWLVADHYGLDASWETLLLEGQAGEAPPKLLVIDDLADRPHQADLLLDQNFFGQATEHRYEGLLLPHCRQLLGPHFALLGPEYALLYPLVPARTELRRVLVFFGGVDPDNLTGLTLEALMDPALAHLAVDVVLGHQSPHRQEVADLVAQRPYTTLHGPLPSLAGLGARADLTIGAGGSTTWERICLGLPTIVLVTDDNQRPFTEALNNCGYVNCIDDISRLEPDKLKSTFLDAVRKNFSRDFPCYSVDGRGSIRVASEMLDCYYRVSPAYPLLKF